MNNSIDRQALVWQEILAAAKEEVEEVQRPDEMTVRQFSQQSGMNINWARKFLERQVELKKLQKRMPKIRGRDTALYSPKIE